MLDFFLVLGQVPGTDYFLSFADVLWIALITLLVPLLWRHRRTLLFEWSVRRLTTFSILAGLERQTKKVAVNRPGLLVRRTT